VSGHYSVQSYHTTLKAHPLKQEEALPNAKEAAFDNGSPHPPKWNRIQQARVLEPYQGIEQRITSAWKDDSGNDEEKVCSRRQVYTVTPDPKM